MGPKKQKQTMSLGTFLGDQSLGSWADEMEDMPAPSSENKGYNRQTRDFQSGPRPEREDRFPPREPLPLPSAPPYTAHLGNLSFDVTVGDIEDFFTGCEVTNVRIVEDKVDRKPKGFGYVEFKTLDGLKQGLAKSGTSFQSRQVRVSVADPPKDKPEQRAFDDWTRKGPLPDLPQNARRTSAGPPGRSFDNYSDAGSERGGGLRMERGGGGSRRGAPTFEGDGKSRDFSNWERKGPPTPIERAPPSREGRPSRGPDRGFERAFERRPSPAWGEGKSQDSGSRPPRPVPERQPTAAEMDNQWRARMKPDPPAKEEKPSASPTPDPSQPSSPAASAAAPAPAPAPAPAMRPRLNLQKRTVSEVPTEGTLSATSATDNKASPFGAARPIDTAAKEAAIAEKREVQRKQREAEDKVRLEKEKAEKAEKAADKTEKKARGDSVPSTPTAGGVQENGASSGRSKRGERGNDQENGEKKEDKASGRQYEILRRMADEEGTGEGDSTVAAEEKADVTDDKQVKPKEVVRPIGSNETPNTPSAEGMEEGGWSTITSAKEKSRHRKRNSMAAARALAS